VWGFGDRADSLDGLVFVVKSGLVQQQTLSRNGIDLRVGCGDGLPDTLLGFETTARFVPWPLCGVGVVGVAPSLVVGCGV
jgi:hypothetical protein